MARWSHSGRRACHDNMGSYWTRPSLPAVSSRLAKTAISLRLRTLWRLSVDETLLEGPASHLQDVVAARRPFIQTEHPVVRQRHLAGQRHLAPPIRPTSR